MDIAGHRLESLRGDPKLQESVEKKTLSADSTLSQKSPFGSWTSRPVMNHDYYIIYTMLYPLQLYIFSPFSTVFISFVTLALAM